MDTFSLIVAERLHLADALDQIRPDDWELPSRCTGWSIHVVAAHLNAPWSASLSTVLLAVARARSLDGGFDRVARNLAASLNPAACIAGLRTHAGSRFTPPGSGPEAPLTDVIVHGDDMLQPLGRAVPVDPEALAVALGWLTSGRATAFAPKGRVAGLTVDATDLDLRFGTGSSTVSGPASALCAALCGRHQAISQLSGDGVAVLASRF